MEIFSVKLIGVKLSVTTLCPLNSVRTGYRKVTITTTIYSDVRGQIFMNGVRTKDLFNEGSKQ